MNSGLSSVYGMVSLHCAFLVLTLFLLTTPVYSITLIKVILLYLHQSHSCLALTRYSAVMTETADTESIKSGLANQGRLLGQHQQTLAGVTQAVDELARHQVNQQQQLADIMSHLRGLSTQNPSPVVSPVASPNKPTTPFFAVCKPEVYDGNTEKCNGFLLQCSVFFSNSPPASDKAKIGFIISRLSGKALDWATAIWESISESSYDTFLSIFRSVFDHTRYGQSSGELLISLKQGKLSVAAFALEFRTLAASSGWNDPALISMFRHGLNPEIQRELACKDDSLTLDQLIALSIRLDQLLSRKPKAVSHTPVVRPVQLQSGNPVPESSSGNPVPESVPAPSPEPMDITRSRLSVAERQRRIRLHLCLYCGGPGHLKANCELRPNSAQASALGQRVESTPRANVVCTPVSKLKEKCFELPVIITTPTDVFCVSALVDSGSEGNFISLDLVEEHAIPTKVLSKSISIHAIDGETVRSKPVTLQTLPLTLQASALHVEQLSLYVLPRTEHPLVLGAPWLKTHDPVISWSLGDITAWSPFCRENCLSLISLSLQSTSVESPNSVDTPDIPSEYYDFSDVFSKAKATELPPHRPYDCSIDLIEGSVLPKARVYPLSRDEEKAMEEYVSEALAQGFIRPSKSPVGSGFFFVKKKDGGLRPCIDYRGLNDITKKFAYPLPLIPAALEQLRNAVYFTKLDLRSAYNLIRIREGDEWKTAFSTTNGHYEYLVMSYGLANAPQQNNDSRLLHVNGQLMPLASSVYYPFLNILGPPYRPPPLHQPPPHK
uniref:ribonuclease H n=1 Tax=Astyanax mexicanus TaxID=7994 RepID=A0A3B1J024_ASTMX